jgi:hypothetical protein
MLSDLARLLGIAENQGNTQAVKMILDLMIWLLEGHRLK